LNCLHHARPPSRMVAPRYVRWAGAADKGSCAGKIGTGGTNRPRGRCPAGFRFESAMRYNYNGQSEVALAVQPISGFVDQCCLLARNARTPAVEVYLAYVVWCLDAGVPVQDQFTFLDMLECYGR